METSSVVFILFQILTFLSSWVSSVSAVEGLTNCEKAIIRYVICILLVYKVLQETFKMYTHVIGTADVLTVEICQSKIYYAWSLGRWDK